MAHADPSDDRPPSSRAGQLARAVGLLAVVAFLALLIWGLAAQAPNRTIDDRLSRAQTAPAPGFLLEVLQRGRIPRRLIAVVERSAADGQIGLDELRGTPVVLNFWASWCEPCRQEAPVLERGWRTAGKDGVLFLGLDMQDVRSDARDFLSRLSVTYPNVREAGKETGRQYGTTGIPETYFIDAGGRVVGHVVGAITPAQLRAGSAAALARQPIRPGEGGARQQAR